MSQHHFPRIALGTAQLGFQYGVANSAGQVSIDEAKQILTLAAHAGMDTLDTAAAYGKSEAVIGTVATQSWKIVTKLPSATNHLGRANSWISNQVNSSLNRLSVKTLHGLLLHRAHDLLNNGGKNIFNALSNMRQTGLVTKIGVSVYSPEELRPLLDSFDFDIVQIPYSIFDRRLVRSGLLHELKQRRIEVHVRSVFLQGLLLMPSTSRPTKFHRWKRLWDQWDQWLATSGTTALQSCLQFALAEPGIDRIIVGVETVTQLQEIIDAASAPCPSIPDELMCSDTMLLNPSQWTSL